MVTRLSSRQRTTGNHRTLEAGEAVFSREELRILKGNFLENKIGMILTHFSFKFRLCLNVVSFIFLFVEIITKKHSI